MGELDNIINLYPISIHSEDYIFSLGEHDFLTFPNNSLKLYSYQEKAVQTMLNYKNGILSAKCGTGKSIMALELIRRIGYKALIICEKKEILNQFKDYLINCFGFKKGDFGIIAEGKVEIGNFVTIALRQTLARIDLLSYKYEFGTIIVDECQNVAGSITKCTQYSKILNNLASEYRYGISATAYRTDGLSRFLYSILGNIKYEVPIFAIQDNIIKAKVQPIYTNFCIPDDALKYDGTINYTLLPKKIALNSNRNDLILHFLRKEKEHFCLILSDRLEGLEELYQKIGGVFINGNLVTKKEKEYRKEAIEKMRKKEEHFLFATYSLAKEGLDIKSLDRLFLVAPTKNKIVLIQSIGRIERKDDNKKDAIVYDFIDQDKYFQDSWKKRKHIYKENDNEFIQ